MKLKKDERGFHHFALLLVILVIIVVGFVGVKVSKNRSETKSKPSEILASKASANEKATAAGKSLSNGQCSGSGGTTFTHLPMDAADFSILIPYGVTVGGHVTPVDHQYFSPTVFNSPKDKYPVYAVADAKITNIEVHPPENGGKGRIRLVFTVSCTFFYYYDLVTSVEPGIDDKHLPIDVKAGQLIGHIGGQTLDFAVWNTKKPLSGFVNPASYDAESWKIYTDNPFPYYTAELRKIVEGKDPRAVEPIQGKIDYDIDGKLIGNWFVKGSGGYGGSGEDKGDYASGHLSIAPDLYDPSVIVVSVGNYTSYPQYGPKIDTSSGDGSSARQYFAKNGAPDPSKVDQNSGVVKFELVERHWLTPDGSMWDNMTFYKGIKANNSGAVVGTVLAQMTGKRELKFEVFPGKPASEVNSFTSKAKAYTR